MKVFQFAVKHNSTNSINSMKAGDVLTLLTYVFRSKTSTNKSIQIVLWIDFFKSSINEILGMSTCACSGTKSRPKVWSWECLRLLPNPFRLDRDALSAWNCLTQFMQLSSSHPFQILRWNYTIWSIPMCKETLFSNLKTCDLTKKHLVEDTWLEK